MTYPFQSTRLAFLGCGHIAQSLIKGFLNFSDISENKIFVSDRNLKKTKRICETFKIQMVSDNEELLEKSSVIFICVKPKDIEELVQSLKVYWQPDHTVFCLAAGISFKTLKKWGLNCKRLIRLMPNTSVSVGQGVLPFCSLNNRSDLNFFVEKILEPLGQVLILENEKLLSPATVGCASGLGFVLELMQYWLEWLQGEGFSHETAKMLVIQTFLGAGQMCRQRMEKNFSDLQKEITSSKGVTHSGLSLMRELELERILRLSFENASLKVKELGKEKSS